MNPFFTQAFREAAPYIHYLRGKTLVIGLSSTLLAPDVLPNLAADLNLMAALGIRLVLVYDADVQIAALCRQTGYEPQYHNGRAVCSETLLRHAKQACGEIQFDVQAALSLGFAHSPQRTPRLHIGSGNFVFAQPMGVIGGIDMAYTGVLRKMNGAAIEHALDHGAVVLIPPLAVSAAGQVYQLCMQEIAQAAALAVHAEKLVFLIDEDGIVNTEGVLFSELTAEEARRLCCDGQIPAAQQTLLATAIDTVEQGISRVQVLRPAKRRAAGRTVHPQRRRHRHRPNAVRPHPHRAHRRHRRFGRAHRTFGGTRHPAAAQPRLFRPTRPPFLLAGTRPPDLRLRRTENL